MTDSEIIHAGTQHLAGEGAWGMELGSVVFFIALFIGFAIQTHRRGSLSIPALCAIGALSVFWQEFYADWACYLAWSPKFHTMPWGSTLWTTPLKPWFVIPSYPLFYGFAFTMMLALCRAAIRKFPSTNLFFICLLTAGPLLALINFGLEVGSVSIAGQWSYVDIIGPAWITDKGNQPILYPNIPFGIWGAAMCYLILCQGTDGHPIFERLTRPERFSSGFSRESMRVLAWVAIWNLTYWFLFCFPLIGVRVLFGQPNALVP